MNMFLPGSDGLKKRNQGKTEYSEEICRSEIPVQKLLSKESKTNELSHDEANEETQLIDNWTKIATYIAIISFLAALTCHFMTESYSGDKNQRDDKITTISEDELMKDLILENLSFLGIHEKRECGASSYEVYSDCVSELIDEITAKLESLKLKNSTVSSKNYKIALENALKKSVTHSLMIEDIKLNHVNFKQLKDAVIAASKLRLGSLSIENLMDIHRKATYLINQDEAGKLRKKIVDNKYYKISSPDEIPSLLKDYVEWLNSEIGEGKNELLLAAMANLILVQIHPFENGNGSVGRMILNYILVNRGYPWVIIPAHGVNEYQNAVKLVHEEGDLTPYFVYILRCIIGSLDLFILDLNLEA